MMYFLDVKIFIIRLLWLTLRSQYTIIGYSWVFQSEGRMKKGLIYSCSRVYSTQIFMLITNLKFIFRRDLHLVAILADPERECLY